MTENGPIEGTVGSTQANPSINVRSDSPNTLPGEVDPHMTISSMADLKVKSPEMYQETLKAIASTTMRQMRGHQERMKEAMRKMRSQ
jgi:hypothetical protein